VPACFAPVPKIMVSRSIPIPIPIPTPVVEDAGHPSRPPPLRSGIGVGVGIGIGIDAPAASCGGNRFTPLVLGPSGVPAVTEAEAARQDPELAVLSAMAHGKDADVERTVRMQTGSSLVWRCQTTFADTVPLPCCARYTRPRELD
jgi:hypothetical protein